MPVNAPRFLGTGADDQALALKMYMNSFEEAPRSSVFLYDTDLPVIERKTVTAGKSWQFLMMGDAPEPDEFTPGDDLLGQVMAIDEGTVTVDKYIVAHKWIPRDQMKISHVDILPKLAKQHKGRIGRLYDRRLFTLAALGARSAARSKNGLTVHSGGNRVTRTGGSVAAAFAASAAGAAALQADLRTLGQRKDEDNIAGGQRYLWLRPDMRTVLAYSALPSSIWSVDYVPGAVNDINKREVKFLEGFIPMGFPNTTTNNGPLPDTNITSESLSKYNGNFTVGASNGTPVAIALSAGMDGQAAIGLVTFEDIQSEVVYFPEKMAWLVMSYVLCGADIMHPWCVGSVEVIT